MYRLDCVCFEARFRFSLTAIRRFAETAAAMCVVAEGEGDSLAGFAIAEREGEALYLVTLDVDPAWRRCGLARRMLRWLEERSPGALRMELHVFAGNAGALAFYAREGFVACGREMDFYGSGWDALCYSRDVETVAEV